MSPPTPNPSGWPCRYNCMRVRKRAQCGAKFICYINMWNFAAVVQCEQLWPPTRTNIATYTISFGTTNIHLAFPKVRNEDCDEKPPPTTRWGMVFCSIAAKEEMRKSGNRSLALLRRSDEYLKHVMPFLKVWFRMYSYRVSCYIVCQISICCMVLTNFVFKCHNHDGINDDVTITGGHLGRDKTYHKIAERFYWKSLWRDVTDYIDMWGLSNHKWCQIREGSSTTSSNSSKTRSVETGTALLWPCIDYCSLTLVMVIYCSLV